MVIHNAISTAGLTPDRRPALREALLCEAGLNPAVPLVGVFGRLADRKGQHVAIAAVGAISGAQLVVVGGALFGEDAAEARLRSQVTRAGLEDRVRFLGFRNDVPALMGGVDIVVHRSIQPEPFGRVIVEAMRSATRRVER